MDLSISDSSKRLGKKSLSGEALENTTLKNGHVTRAKMFWTNVLGECLHSSIAIAGIISHVG